MKPVLCLIVFLLPSYAQAVSKPNKPKPIEKILLFDRYMSPYSAATLLITSRNLINELEDYLIPARRNTTWIRIISNVTHFYIGAQLMTFNHEIWGHGFRIRSLGGTVSEYKFTFFKGASTHAYLFWMGDTDVPILISIGGIEANQVLAKEIFLQHFKHRSLDTRTYILSLAAFLDLMNYVLSTSPKENKKRIKATI